jgi:hypothetical protein
VLQPPEDTALPESKGSLQNVRHGCSTRAI